jgi:phosphosulfolactate synthase (CoM biosynthesis protein A)
MLVRRGSRMAGRFNTDWFVVFVETPNETPDQIDAELQRHLFANIEKAKELGAETVRIKARIRWKQSSISPARTTWGTSSWAARNRPGGSSCSGVRYPYAWFARLRSSTSTSSR